MAHSRDNGSPALKDGPGHYFFIKGPQIFNGTAAPPYDHHIHAAGIQSPGLTSAPAIAEYLVGLIADKENLAKKDNWNGILPKKPIFHRMSMADQAALIAENNLYGRVICRCETITEGEIVDAINSPCGARTVDGVKRRTRAGMGRCQGGFCGPRVTQILARELNIPVSAVRKELVNSHMFYEKNSANEEDA